MILSPTLLASTTFVHVLHAIMPTPFLNLVFLVYQSLNPDMSSYLGVSPTHFVSSRQIKLFLSHTHVTLNMH